MPVLARLVASLVPGVLAAIASGQGSGYLIDSSLDRLFVVDVATGVATPGPSTNNNGLITPADLVFRADTGELWTVDLVGGEVGTLDPLTGWFTPIFQTGLSGWQGMAYDENAEVFYLLNQSSPDFYALDARTGVTTSVGHTGVGLMACLEIDPAGALYSIEFWTGAIVRIDPATGVPTRVATTIAGFQGLGIDANSGAWYATNTYSDGLHAIDPVSGVQTLVGANGSGIDFAKGFDLDFPAGIRIAGRGCPDASGTTLGMSLLGGPPQLGDAVQVGCRSGSSVPYFLVVGTSDQQWLGIQLPLDLAPFGAPGCTLYAAHDLVLGPFPAGSRLPLALPASPLLVGATSFWQGYQLDPALPSALGLASSNLLTLVLQP